MRKFQWFVGQHVFYKRGEIGGVWWGDTGEILVTGYDGHLALFDWGKTTIRRDDPDFYPLKYVLERNARVLREQAAGYMRKAKDLPRRGS